jgi:NADP-reducing hydrogenase subunit HndD
VPGMDKVYCVPGDITEAVLRASYGLLAPDAEQPLKVQFVETETEGVRTTSVQLDKFSVKAVALTGLPNAIPYLEAMKAGKSDIAFFEMLACPMGCVSGGGQPKVLLPQERTGTYLERARLSGIPDAECLQTLARNAAVQRTYSECFDKPCGDRSNHAMYTQYVERKLSQ